MDNEEFKRKLSEVAEWRIPKTEKEQTISARKKRGRKSNEERYEEEHEQVFLELFEGVNPTYPPMLVKLKCQATTCEDCGKYCANGRQKEKKLYETNKKRHWREKCVTCERFQNPFTGEFDLVSSNAAIKWNEFLRNSKMKYRTATNQLRQQILEENPNIIIRSYPENLSKE